MSEVLTTVSPITNRPILTRDGLNSSDVALLPALATRAYNLYRLATLEQRQQIISRALQIISDKQDVLARELTEQMGRPIAYASKEIATAVARSRYLLKISSHALSDTAGEPEDGFRRYIRKMPVGPVLILFAWNVSHENYRHSSLNVLNGGLVPLSCFSELPHPSFASRKLRLTQAFTSNTYHRRADT